MSILAWIEDQRKLKLLNAPKYTHPSSDGSKGLWTRCDHCGVILYIKHLKENQRVCFGCGYHLQMDSQERIAHLIDDTTWRPLDETLSPCDPLGFRDQKLYTERLKDAQDRTGLQDAVQTGTGMLDGIPIALGVMDFHFMGGSMGSVVGEKITRLIEYAAQEGLTLLLVSASGGARMQEGIFSLMQMAKISSALQIYQSSANLLYISVLTSPTTGGVTASFAMLGDLIFAEPKALIGFAGRRVIEQTLQEELPNDFQRSEYLLHHGLLDLIVPRCFLKQALSETITLYKDAPFKRPGSLPYGVQNRLYFLTEEKARRKWQEWAISKTIKPAQPSFRNQLASTSPDQEDAVNEVLDSCSSADKDCVAIDLDLQNALKRWLLDPSSDASYRDILLSFQAMLSFLPYTSSDDAGSMAGPGPLSAADLLPATESLLRPVPPSGSAQHQLEQHRSRVGEEGAGLKPATFLEDPRRGGEAGSTTGLGGTFSASQAACFASAASPPGAGSSFSDGLELGLQEGIGWRALYTNQKPPLKARLLEHLQGADMPTGTEDPGKLETSTISLTNAGLRTTERRLFYRMILNRSGVWKEGQ